MSGHHFLTEDDFLPGVEEDSGAGRRFAWMASVAGLLLLAAAYAGAAVVLGRYVPAGTTVSGVAVGGLTRTQAVTELRRQLGGLESQPVQLMVGGTTVTLDPSSAGLHLDPEGSLAGLTGPDFDPRRLLDHLRGGVVRRAAVSVDATALAAALHGVADQVRVPPRDASLSVDSGKVALVPAQAGTALDVTATMGVVAAEWPAASPIRAVTMSLAPAISDEDAQRVRESFADPAMSGPVTIETPAGSFRVTPAHLAAGISFTGDGGQLRPVFDDDRLVAAVVAAGRHAGILTKPRDATPVVRHGRPELLPAAPGRALRTDGLATSVVSALTDPARTVTATLERTAPKVSTKQLRAIFATSTLASVSTVLPAGRAGRANVTHAAAALDGTWIPPTEAVSLVDQLGRLSAKRGYQKAPEAVNGRLRMRLGGGVSQVSTGLFAAALRAGIPIEGRVVPTFADPRYPVGQDAAVGQRGQDLILSNDTEDGILVGAAVSGDHLTVTLFGKPTWSVRIHQGPRTNIVAPRDLSDAHRGCVPQQPAQGFDVTVTRTVSRNGSLVRTDSFPSHYIPRDRVTCT